MSNLLGEDDTFQPNLFTPDFGQPPYSCVGRDDMLRDIRSGLGAGPRDPRFTSLLLGPRGSGKTVTLNMIEDIAYNAGWLVLPLDASTPNITERLEERIEWTRDEDETLASVPRGETEATTKAVRVPGAEWRRLAVRAIEPKWGIRRQLTTLAEHAAANGSAVLLTIDEMHSGSLEELRRLSSDVQHITKREQRPLAFVGAGLAEMRHTLLEDRKMAFFQRCRDFDMAPLTRADALKCISKTVRDAGGKFLGDALSDLAEAAGPLPFRMQLLGYYAWTVSDAPSSPVTEADAAHAIAETDRDMHRRVFSPTWHTLSEHEQAFLRALSESGGQATPRQIASRIGDSISASSISRAENHLVNVGCITHEPNGSLRFGPVMAQESVSLFAERERQYAQAALHESDARPRGATTDAQQCGKHMPRANARCILRAGHAGRCRSIW
ncbi:MAG: ATP-binding protein [Acidimicrobiaceae bacterium]|nr:ATP-binding protein [Acidimicrobiaceae bacterium]